jgi:hypothetical protein
MDDMDGIGLPNDDDHSGSDWHSEKYWGI